MQRSAATKHLGCRVARQSQLGGRDPSVASGSLWMTTFRHSDDIHFVFAVFDFFVTATFDIASSIAAFCAGVRTALH